MNEHSANNSSICKYGTARYLHKAPKYQRRLETQHVNAAGRELEVNVGGRMCQVVTITNLPHEYIVRFPDKTFHTVYKSSLTGLWEIKLNP
jgi:hypothetical protein